MCASVALLVSSAGAAAQSPPPVPTVVAPELRLEHGSAGAAMTFFGGCLDYRGWFGCSDAPPGLPATAFEVATPGSLTVRAAEPLAALEVLSGVHDERIIEVRAAVERLDDTTWSVHLADALPDETLLRLSATFAAGGEASGGGSYGASLRVVPEVRISRASLKRGKLTATVRTSGAGRVRAYVVRDGSRRRVASRRTTESTRVRIRPALRRPGQAGRRPGRLIVTFDPSGRGTELVQASRRISPRR